MKRTIKIGAFVFSLLLCVSSQCVFADDDHHNHDDGPTKNQCIKDANAAHKAAVDAANDERKLAKLICEAGSPEKAACLQNCLQARIECIKPINDITKACYEAADAAFATGRAACKASAACSGDCRGNTAFQECMVPIRVAVYNANKACRLADNKEGRKACRATYRACNATCKSS